MMQGLVVLKELRDGMGWDGKDSFQATLGPAGLGLDDDWLYVFISLAPDGNFSFHPGVKSLTCGWDGVRDGVKLSLRTLPRLPLEPIQLVMIVLGYRVQFWCKNVSISALKMAGFLKNAALEIR
jgi:hypothetical protein